MRAREKCCMPICTLTSLTRPPGLARDRSPHRPQAVGGAPAVPAGPQQSPAVPKQSQPVIPATAAGAWGGCEPGPRCNHVHRHLTSQPDAVRRHGGFSATTCPSSLVSRSDVQEDTIADIESRQDAHLSWCLVCCRVAVSAVLYRAKGTYLPALSTVLCSSPSASNDNPPYYHSVNRPSTSPVPVLVLCQSTRPSVPFIIHPTCHLALSWLSWLFCLGWPRVDVQVWRLLEASVPRSTEALSRAPLKILYSADSQRYSRGTSPPTQPAPQTTITTKPGDHHLLSLPHPLTHPIHPSLSTTPPSPSSLCHCGLHLADGPLSLLSRPSHPSSIKHKSISWLVDPSAGAHALALI